MSEPAPNLGPPRLVNSGFIRHLAGRVDQMADAAPSALSARARYVAAARCSLYAKPRFFSPRFVEIHERIGVQTLGPKLPVQGFDIGVVGRLARPAEVECDPAQERPIDEFPC